MPDLPPESWRHLAFFQTDWPRIATAIGREQTAVLPPEGQRFAAMDLTPPDKVRVVILGQDPYPTPGHAHGLAFSVTPETRPLPRSLSNIFKEMEVDIGIRPVTGDLRSWARQGVLLLNSCLTVPSGQAGGHARLGWQALAAEALSEVSKRPCAFLLWGAYAQGLGQHILCGKHLIIKSPHPSPLSARRGFFGSRPFSKVNEWLTARNETPIDWAASDLA